MEEILTLLSYGTIAIFVLDVFGGMAVKAYRIRRDRKRREAAARARAQAEAERRRRKKLFLDNLRATQDI